MKRTIGGDRLGSGKKMKVDLKTYERSTHDLGYVWRSTMASGTLIPFMSELGLPGDTFDIDLECDVKTHPTIGPLFGSYKVQLDVFMCPIRLYIRELHNNKLGIGLNMSSVKLPQLALNAYVPQESDPMDNQQVNPSCILSYLNIRGVGRATGMASEVERRFNAIPFLSYWDIYKNYYANKQEEIGAFIHGASDAVIPTTGITDVIWTQTGKTDIIISEDPNPPNTPATINPVCIIKVIYTTPTPTGNTVVLMTTTGAFTAAQIFQVIVTATDGTDTWLELSQPNTGNWGAITNWRYATAGDLPVTSPEVHTFPLSNIDDMREDILGAPTGTAFMINVASPEPYNLVLGGGTNRKYATLTQEGLALKTYQNDLFNNWMQTEWIDGTNGISEVTAVDTSGGSFTIDTLNLSRKVYDMLNRIAISGGTYDDWQDTVYTHERYTRPETPIYMGGLSKELIFQEVVSNSEANGEAGSQPLGTLAGKGVMGSKHKGGKVTVKVDEPCYIMGIVSLTPRLDYSQGNKWDVNLKTMDDLHKPALDEIGFQDLITDQMAWWDTEVSPTYVPTFKSAGKQPAWINYMTNVNQVRGNFAIADNEMFMTLNRRYEFTSTGSGGIADLTTYIDPMKFNHIFAQTSRDAQNFWTQIGVDIIARRKMSAKIMPNL